MIHGLRTISQIILETSGLKQIFCLETFSNRKKKKRKKKKKKNLLLVKHIRFDKIDCSFAMFAKASRIFFPSNFDTFQDHLAIFPQHVRTARCITICM